MPTQSAFRPDIDSLRAVNREPRSPERLREHYEVERELAARLRESRPEERSSLYGQVYTELFSRLPDHPQHRIDPARRQHNTAMQVAFLRRYASPSTVYVEIGCGDAAVAEGMAPFVREAIGIDVTPALIDPATAPANFRFVQTTGTAFDLPTGMADLVYSNQLMEHLHPEDARVQLQEICRILKPGGCYICSTPNRVTGPHDISVYFDYAPTGFHLCEYDHRVLAKMFGMAGFRSVKASVTLKGRQLTLPVAPVTWIERVLLALPLALRTRLARLGPIRNLAGVILIGRK